MRKESPDGIMVGYEMKDKGDEKGEKEERGHRPRKSSLFHNRGNYSEVQIRKQEREKELNERRSKSSGHASTLRSLENEMRVFSAIAKYEPTLDELKAMKIVSRPDLYIHINSLLKFPAFIYKDTVKEHETDDPKRVNKMVFKPVGSLLEQFTRNFVELRMDTSKLIEFDEPTKKRLEKHYDAIAKIWSKWLKGQAQRDKEVLNYLDKREKGGEGKYNRRKRDNDLRKAIKEDAERGETEEVEESPEKMKKRLREEMKMEGV